MFDMLNEWWAWYRSSGFDHATIAVPLVETVVLFLALTICLLFRFPRAGLILACLFLYRWGWTVNIDNFTTDPTIQSTFSVSYLVFGILAFTFTIISMLFHAGSRNE